MSEPRLVYIATVTHPPPGHLNASAKRLAANPGFHDWLQAQKSQTVTPFARLGVVWVDDLECHPWVKRFLWASLGTAPLP